MDETAVWIGACAGSLGLLTYVLLAAPDGVAARPRRGLVASWERLARHLDDALALAGLPRGRHGARAFLLTSAGLGLAGAALASWRFGGLFLPLVAAAVAALLPAALLGAVRGRRRSDLEAALVEALTGLRDGLTGSLSIEQACVQLGRTGPPALRPYWRELERALARGVPFVAALRTLGARVADPTMDMVVAALVFNERHGSAHIREVLARLGHAAAQRRAIEEERRAVQEKTVLQGRVLLASAPLLIGLQLLVNPGYWEVYNSAVGRALLGGAGVLMVGAYWQMLRLGRTARTPRILGASGAPAALGGQAGIVALAALGEGTPLGWFIPSGLEGWWWAAGLMAGLAWFLASAPLGPPRPDLAAQVRRLDPEGFRAERGGRGGRAGMDSGEPGGLAALAAAARDAFDDVAARWLARLGLLRGEALAAQLALVWPGVTPARFAGRRIGFAAGFGLLPAAMDLLGVVPGGVPLWLFALAAALGFWWPTRRLRRDLRERQDRIVRQLPIIVDLLMLAVSAGDGLEAALRGVAREATGDLAEELRRLTRALDGGGATLGRALATLAARNGVRELTMLTDQLRASELHGSVLLATLIEQGDALRRAEQNRLTADAGRGGIRMLAPLLGCIFPVILIVTIFPVLAQIFGGGA